MYQRRNYPYVITFDDRYVDGYGKLQIGDVLQKANWPLNATYTLLRTGKSATLFPKRAWTLDEDNKHIEYVAIDETGMLAPSYIMLALLNWLARDTIRVRYIKDQMVVLSKIEYFFDDDED